MFSKKATKIDEIFTVDLPLGSKCQIDSEDFVNFCGLLRKHELYPKVVDSSTSCQVAPPRIFRLLLKGKCIYCFFTVTFCG